MNFDTVKQATDFAARVISSGRPTTRAFDSCFEWYGATAVAIALYRRTQKRPDTKLAKNLFKYISEEITVEEALVYSDWADLEILADHLK